MTLCWRCWYWHLAGASWLAMGGAVAISRDCALAQITPDGTLGAESSVVTPQDPGSTVDVVQGGATRGANLFHSFEQFSVLTGREAFFNNAADIQNIISRVTGESISNIDGLIRANGTANLFVLNPNGIIFGPNASLSIGGSFLASTASSLNFADGTQFSATEPQTTSLLTVSVPIGLQFGPGAGEIRVRGPGAVRDRNGLFLNREAGLSVQPKETLALVGSGVELEGGILTTAGGRIELGSVAGPSLVSLVPTDKGWFLGYKGVQNFQDIQLSNRAVVDASGVGGGDIQLQGRRVTLSNGSQIEASTLTSEPGGTLTVTASELVKLIGTSANALINTGLGAVVYSGATGAGGSVTLKTRHLIVQDGAYVFAGTLGSGKGGNLTVTDAESVELVGSSSLSTQTQGPGDAGNLTIATRRLSVLDGAYVSADTSGLGKGGNLTVTDAESVELVGSSSLSTQTQGPGDAGNLTIATRRLSVLDGAYISADTSGSGKGGDLTVAEAESVELKGNIPSRLFTDSSGIGDAGNLTIATKHLSIEDGAQVSAATSSQGNGGELRVNAINSVNLSGVGPRGFSSGLFTRTIGVGQGGNITIDTSVFRVADGAVVDARTTTAGSGGNITVKADTFEAVNGGQLLASAFRGSSGRAGNITVNTTNSVTISGSVPTSVKRFMRVGPNISDIVENDDPNSGLFVLSRGSGNAGKLEITARSVSLDNQGKLSAETTLGQGGDITLHVQDLLLLRRNSSISTTAGTTGARGNGGNINIGADLIVAVPFENSDIAANSFVGEGGTIDIEAEGILGLVQRNLEELKSLLGTDDPKKLNPARLPSNDITAISQTNPSLSGQVNINTQDVDPSQGLVALPAEIADVTGLIAQGCPAGVGSRASKFVITGRGGLPPNPSEALSSDAIQVDWVTLYPGVENRSSPPVSTNPPAQPAPIVEAQGWIIGPDREVILTAQAPTITPHSSWRTPAECQKLSFSEHRLKLKLEAPH